MKTRGRNRPAGPALRSSLPEGSQGGFTLIEVMIALVIIALAAVVLLGQRVDVVREATRARDLRTVWTLAAQKMADLELDRSLWTGTGGSASGDFAELDPVYAGFTWESQVELLPVEVREFPQPGEKPKEIFRLVLSVRGEGLGEPVVLMALFPVAPPPQAPAPGAGTPPPPDASENPPPPPGPKK